MKTLLLATLGFVPQQKHSHYVAAHYRGWQRTHGFGVLTFAHGRSLGYLCKSRWHLARPTICQQIEGRRAQTENMAKRLLRHSPTDRIQGCGIDFFDPLGAAGFCTLVERILLGASTSPQPPELVSVTTLGKASKGQMRPLVNSEAEQIIFFFMKMFILLLSWPPV